MIAFFYYRFYLSGKNPGGKGGYSAEKGIASPGSVIYNQVISGRIARSMKSIQGRLSFCMRHPFRDKVHAISMNKNSRSEILSCGKQRRNVDE